MRPKSRFNVGAWLRLVRLPNILTVPGDALAGAALATAASGTAPVGWRLTAALLSVVCIYVVGLILNDLCDYRRDCQLRPDRPLPDGSISLAAARLGCLLALAAGLALAAVAGRRPMQAFLLLTVLVFVYDFQAKHHNWQGPVVMGLCRGMGVGIGASLVGWPLLAIPAVIVWTGYIAAVTRISDRENAPSALGVTPWLPTVWFAAAGSLIWVMAFVGDGRAWAWTAALPLLAGLLRIVLLATGLSRGTQPPAAIQRSIGVYLRALLPLQAAAAVATGRGPWMVVGGVLLIVVWPLSSLAARRFYAS